MSTPQIIKLLEFCLTHTYFLFQGKYYEWVHGAAMGTPISPLIANLMGQRGWQLYGFWGAHKLGWNITYGDTFLYVKSISPPVCLMSFRVLMSGFLAWWWGPC